MQKSSLSPNNGKITKLFTKNIDFYRIKTCLTQENYSYVIVHSRDKKDKLYDVKKIWEGKAFHIAAK